MSGVNAAKLFKKSSLPTSSDKVCRDIGLVEQNNGNDGRARRDRMDCWASLESLIPYFTGLTLSAEQFSSFKKLADDFGKLFTNVFG